MYCNMQENPTVQKIMLSGNDDETTTDIFGDEVYVYPCANSSLDCERTTASNKISLSPAVKFFWEYQYHTGRLICRHHSRPLIAYCINSKCDSVSGDNSMIRIRNTQTAHKVLLKCFVGRVVTMAFAFCDEPILAVLDYSKTLYCFKMVSARGNSETIETEKILLLHPEEVVPHTNQQSLAWCPWQPSCQRPSMVSDSKTELLLPDDPFMLLAASCGNKVEVIDVSMAVKLLREKYPELIPSGDRKDSMENSKGVGWTRDQLREVLSTRCKTHLAYAKADDHSDVITVVSVSRECSCFATAGMDGKVCLYSLLSSSVDDGMSPIHIFSPHNGAPIYGLIFIDNDETEDSRCTWSYLLTGASFNRELRLWSCREWRCEQTLRFCPANTVAITSDTGVATFMTNAKPSIIMARDPTSSVVVASDITRRVLYILELTRCRAIRNILRSKKDKDHMPGLRFSSISEFLLTAPCILFALGEFRRKMLPNSISSKENRSMDMVSLEIHAIHTWYLLNGTITFSLPRREELYVAAEDETALDNRVSESGDQPQPTVTVSTSLSIDMLSVSDLTHVTPRPLSISPEPLPDVKERHPSYSPHSEPASKQEPIAEDARGPVTTADNFDQSNAPLRLTDLTIDLAIDPDVQLNSNVSPSEVDIATEAPVGERLSNLLPSTFKPTSLSSSLDGMSISFGEKCALSLADQVEHHDAPVHRSDVDLLATLRHDGAQSPSVDTEVSPLKPVDLIRLNSPPPSCVNHDSALITRRMSDPENNSHPGTEYLECTSPSQTKVDSWISSGFVDVDGEQSRDRGQAMWPVIAEFPHHHSSASSSASSSLRATGEKQSCNLESLFHEAPALTQRRRSPEEVPSSGSMDSMEHMLRRLLADTNNRKVQMEMLFEKLSQAQNQLEQLASTQTEMNKRLNALQECQGMYHVPMTSRTPNCQGYLSESEAYETSSTTRSKGTHKTGLTSPLPRARQVSSSSMDANAMPEWGQQILLQLRSQQGDFARRCSHLEGMLNKVNSVTNDLNQSHRRQQTKQTSSSVMDARIDQLPKSTCDLIRPVLRAEMQNAFVNNTNRLVEPIQKSISIAIQDSLKSLPSALADSINRLLRDKNFAAQFARSTSTALSSDLAVAYRDSLQRTLVPALDKNINRLFEELNAVFKTGTQQYLQQIEQSIRPTPDATALASAVVSQIIPEIQGWAQSSTGSMNNDTCIGSGRNTRPDRMLSPIRQPKNNVDQQYSNTAGMTKPEITHLSSPDPRFSVTGCASTTNPVESSKIKEDPNKPFRQAQKLIKDNKLVEALELALVSTNQELVLDVCCGIDPDKLFGSGQHLIAQNVLLSLIHQLSCGDISVALELKLKYLREAVLSLDKDDPTTTEHGPRILGLLNRRLQNYLQSSATDTAPSMANVSASLRFRVLKLQHEAKWILDCLTKVNSSI